MEKNTIIQQIEEHLSKGETEEALDMLLEFTRQSDNPAHDEAILLSGQFKQWKRENMLGIQQSNSELRRIEATILDIVTGRAPVDVPNIAASPTTATPPPPTPSSKSNILPIITGALGALVIVFGVWYVTNNSSESSSDNDSPTTQQTEISQSKNTSTTPVEETVDEIIKNHISAGEELRTEETIYSANKKFFLKVQDDGNLVVYQVLTNGGEDAIWSTNTQRSYVSDVTLKMQTDGNLVLELDGEAKWSTQTQAYFDEKFGTTEYKPIKLELKNSGNLVLISSTGKEVWSSL
jgi:hypothetical protein